MASAASSDPLTRSYASSIRGQVAYLAEARGCEILQGANDINRYFVRAFESGSVDCGVYQGPIQLPDSPADKLLAVVDTDTDTKTILPIEIKDFAPFHMKGAIYWRFYLSMTQARTCQAIVISAAKDPDFVAVLPSYYIRRTFPEVQNQRRSVYSKGIRPLWTLQQLPAFSPEFAPFMVPTLSMGQILASMRAFNSGTSSVWRNDYTGATFKDITPLNLYSCSLLKPDFAPHLEALHEIEPILRALPRHSKSFRAELVRVCPLLGDLKFVDLTDGAECMVEAKRDHVNIIKDEETGSLIWRHLQDSRGFPSRQVFSWKAQWDFLYTIYTRKRKPQDWRAFLIPRDEFPVGWWNTPIQEHGNTWLDWPSDRTHIVDQYAVDLTTDDLMARDIVKILKDRKLKCGSLKARKPIAMVPLHNPSLDETSTFLSSVDIHPDDAGSDVDDERDTWSSRNYTRGFGSFRHPKLRGRTYEQWAAAVLMEICRQNGQGIVLDLGSYNKTCRFVLARFMWSQANKIQYDRDREPPVRAWHFGRNTAVIPLSFLRLWWPRSRHACGTRSSTFWAERIAQRPPSLVICDLYPYTCTRLPHSRFVIPSKCILLSQHRRNKYLELDEGVLDQYIADEDELIDTILNLLSGQSQVAIGLDQRLIEMIDYCYSLGDILNEGVSGFAMTTEPEETDSEEDID